MRYLAYISSIRNQSDMFPVGRLTQNREIIVRSPQEEA
jgi:hypothetical protein